MTIILQIIGFHDCDGCSRKVRIALRKIGVKLVELDRETGNVTIETAEDPEVIKQALARQLKKSVKVLSRDLALVPANQIPSSMVSHQVAANQRLDLQALGLVVLSLAQVLDGVEITNSNTRRINFIHREPHGNIGVQIMDHADAVEYAPRQPPQRAPPWAATQPSAPPMPIAEKVVYGYPLYFYGASMSHNHDHDYSNGGCTIM